MLLAVFVVSLCAGLFPSCIAQQGLPISDTADLTFTVSSGFPTSLFPSYYVEPAPTQEPQPKIYDTVLNYTYPLELTDPTEVPAFDGDPVYYPTPIQNVTNGIAIVADAQAQIKKILAGSGNKCTKCKDALVVGRKVAQLVPSLVPDAMIALCQATNFESRDGCTERYQSGNSGAIFTQILALGDMAGLDGHYVCYSLSPNFCKAPYTIPSKASFPKPKPSNPTIRTASGKRVKVLHMSDFHLDPRYQYQSGAKCPLGFTCGSATSAGARGLTDPAPLYGAYTHDTPYFLAAAVLSSVGPLTGTTFENTTCDLDRFAWSIYTGDIVAHDLQSHLSRNYTEYAEYSVYHMLKSYIPSGPIFPVLGNHDSNPQGIDAPRTLPGVLGQQQSWNYQHVSALWQHNGWLTPDAASQARMHYAAYSINHPLYPRLRIITLNTDFWYIQNYLNFINTTDADNSGNLAFLINELQDAEDNGERVWILGHVLTGWDGSQALPNPSDLFYQIVDRYSPHVIANTFWGHTHEDQFMIYYANNGTSQTSGAALAVGWIGPSVTPLGNLNTGYRMYTVDTGDFSIYDAYTYYSDVSTFSSLDGGTHGPVFQLEYSTRDAYPIGWPTDAPLNATYWHSVTEAMLTNTSLVSKFNTYQGKSSVKSPKCTSKACVQAKVCYMRSGSVALGSACPQGFSSVQNVYTGEDLPDSGGASSSTLRATTLRTTTLKSG